jgi:hypothetical protein
MTHSLLNKTINSCPIAKKRKETLLKNLNCSQRFRKVHKNPNVQRYFLQSERTKSFLKDKTRHFFENFIQLSILNALLSKRSNVARVWNFVIVHLWEFLISFDCTEQRIGCWWRGEQNTIVLCPARSWFVPPKRDTGRSNVFLDIIIQHKREFREQKKPVVQGQCFPCTGEAAIFSLEWNLIYFLSTSYDT